MINWLIKNEVQDFLRNVKSKNILDFGCGDQRYKKYINDTNNYIGLDVEVSGHSDLYKKYDIVWDKKKIPIEDNYFDYVIMTEVLEHLENVEITLMEIKRVLKNNGLMLITVPFFWKEHEKPYDFQRYTSYGLKKLLLNYDFEIVNQKKLVKKKNAILELINSEFNNLYKKKNNRYYFSKFYCFCLKIFFRFIFKFLISDNFFEDYYIGNSIIVKKISI